MSRSLLTTTEDQGESTEDRVRVSTCNSGKRHSEGVVEGGELVGLDHSEIRPSLGIAVGLDSWLETAETQNALQRNVRLATNSRPTNSQEGAKAFLEKEL